MSLKKELSKVKKSLLRIRAQVLGTSDYERFVIITRSRTGSNLLISLLDSHPQITAKGELFRRLNGRQASKIWHDIFEVKQFNAKHVGFKIFYYHPLDIEDKTVWRLLSQDKSIKIIHLVRKNMLKTLVSRKIADKTDTWTNKGNAKFDLKDRQVELGLDECLEEFDKIKIWESETRAKFKDHKFHEISYEELIEDRQNQMNGIFEFLGVPVESVDSSLKKQNKEQLSDLILNYSDLREELSKTKWAYLLED